jgi:hypothetical protein
MIRICHWLYLLISIAVQDIRTTILVNSQQFNIVGIITPYIFSMTTELNSRPHIIGFPYHTNSKNNDDGNENKKQDIEISDTSSVYKPLYEISNEYLKNDIVYYIWLNLFHVRDKAK